ncbi:MAG: AAA family ATPase [Chlorobiaceae bacterium]|nr:AAA family ATPase [Chlorobiaceae bacterium]
MIKRINVLKRVGRFTSLNPTQGHEGDFSKLNVIYANNACGKSTLCDVLRSLGTGNPAYIIGRQRFGSTEQPEIIITCDGTGGPTTVRFQRGIWLNRGTCPPIYIYDDRFVSENVIIGHHINVDQRRNLYGLVIGDQAISLQQAVDNAEQSLTNSTASFTSARDNLTLLLPAGYTIEPFRSLAQIQGVDSQIETVTGEIRTAEQTIAKADSIRARRPIGVLPIAEIPKVLETVLNSTLDTVAHTAQNKIRDHLDSTSRNLSLSWINQGFEAQLGVFCPYCGQETHGLEILEAYQAFFSGALQSYQILHGDTIRNVNATFGESAQNQLRQTLIAHGTEQVWWQDAAGYTFELPRIRETENIVAALDHACQAMLAALTRKQESPMSSINLSEDETLAINAWREIAVELEEYNESLSDVNAALRRYQENSGTIDLVPLQNRLATLKACKQRYIPEVISAYGAYDIALDEKASAQQVKQRANEALRTQSNQLFESYGAKINELLELFSADFRIVSDGVNFRGGSPSGQLAIELYGTRVSSTPESASTPSQPSLANTLSGGDRSALALAYFLARVELAGDVSNAVVVFDDPYHNQDRSRRQCTIERIHHLTGLSSQCIVFSHDLEFARAVEKRPGTSTKTFIL